MGEVLALRPHGRVRKLPSKLANFLWEEVTTGVTEKDWPTYRVFDTGLTRESLAKRGSLSKQSILKAQRRGWLPKPRRRGRRLVYPFGLVLEHMWSRTIRDFGVEGFCQIVSVGDDYPEIMGELLAKRDLEGMVIYHWRRVREHAVEHSV